MRLLGSYISPYVRRVAISLNFLELDWMHESISVFSEYDRFAAINPVVKAPTLVTDSNIVLMDSSLILSYLDLLALPEKRLFPEDALAFAQCQRIVGLALAACEKTVQIVYERTLRPAEKVHQSWIERCEGQMLCAFQLLEDEIANISECLVGSRLTQADITAAVTWTFTNQALAGFLEKDKCPALAQFAERIEKRSEFLSIIPA